MMYIGIDPGKSGAMAVIKGKDVTIIPFSEQEYVSTLRKCKPSSCRCVLERVGAMPKQGLSSTFAFGQNYGYLMGMLEALSIPYEIVSPQRWKKEFGATSDKNTSISVARRLFPLVSLKRSERSKKDDDNFAEALLIAEYARRRSGLEAE